MITAKYKTFVIENNNGAITSTVTFQGTKEEMEALCQQYSGHTSVNIAGIDIFGNVKKARTYQEAGQLWCCEIVWGRADDNLSVIPIEPLSEYGKKSSQLTGGLLAVPIENHPDFLINWKYYLAAREHIDAIPDWWETADDMTISDPNYKWIESPSELSLEEDWKIICPPTMPGVTHYDVATYVIRESVKCRSASHAGTFIRGMLNKIVSPVEDFGLQAACGGEWKCDGVEVSWDTRNWIASLTYTLSADEMGWDSRLYKPKG